MKQTIIDTTGAPLSLCLERKQSRAVRAMFFCCLGCLAAMAATGLSSLILPATIFLGLALYFRVDPDGTRFSPCPVTAGTRDGDAPCHAHEATLPVATRTGFTPITFHTTREYRYETAGRGGKLVIGAGTIRGAMSMEFHPERGTSEEMDTVACSLRLTDMTGHVWECRLLMLPYLLTDPIEPGAQLPARGFFFCDDAPPDWQSALESNRLISGVHNLLDTRDAGELVISGTPHRIYFKQQGPLIDVAYLDTTATFIVRISRLHCDIHSSDALVGSRLLPPFCYAVPAEDLLFLAAPHHYYSYHEEWYAMEEGIRKKKPLFTAPGLKDTPHPLVRLLPDESSPQ